MWQAFRTPENLHPHSVTGGVSPIATVGPGRYREPMNEPRLGDGNRKKTGGKEKGTRMEATMEAACNARTGIPRGNATADPCPVPGREPRLRRPWPAFVLPARFLRPLCPAEKRIHPTPHDCPAMLEHVGVDLRSLNVVVTNQLLDRADVVTHLQQVASKNGAAGNEAPVRKSHGCLGGVFWPRSLIRRRISHYHAEPPHNPPQEPLYPGRISLNFNPFLGRELFEPGFHSTHERSTYSYISWEI